MIKIVMPPAGAGEGWDLADSEAEGWTGDRVEAWIAEHAVDPSQPQVQATRPKVSLATADHAWRGE